MVCLARCYLRWLVMAGLLVVVGAAWSGWRLVTPLPGSLEHVFSLVQIGMSQDEAVAVLRTFDCRNLDGVHSSGATRDGRKFLHIGNPTFDDLPPPRTIDHCTLLVMDEQGHDLEVSLGPGGKVTGKRFAPHWWEPWLLKVQRWISI